MDLYDLVLNSPGNLCLNKMKEQKYHEAHSSSESCRFLIFIIHISPVFPRLLSSLSFNWSPSKFAKNQPLEARPYSPITGNAPLYDVTTHLSSYYFNRHLKGYVERIERIFNSNFSRLTRAYANPLFLFQLIGI